MSEANSSNLKIFYSKRSREDLIKVACDVTIRDWNLWDNGFKEWQDASEIANTIDVHTVFVSPLRRALQTAYYVFWNHPNFDDIKFIVVPKLKEGLKTCSDIPNNIYETIEEFSKKFKNFDASLFKLYKVYYDFYILVFEE